MTMALNSDQVDAIPTHWFNMFGVAEAEVSEMGSRVASQLLLRRNDRFVSHRVGDDGQTNVDLDTTR